MFFANDKHLRILQVAVAIITIIYLVASLYIMIQRRREERAGA